MFIYKDGKYAVTERKTIEGDHSITLKQVIESSTQVSRKLMNERAEFEGKARDYIEKRLKRGVGQFMGIRGVRREEASKALYCYLADWNQVVIKEFNEKIKNLKEIRIAIRDAKDGGADASRSKEQGAGQAE